MILLLLLLLALPASGQGYAGGVVARNSTDPNSPYGRVVPTFHVQTTVEAQSSEFAWGVLSVLDNYAQTSGESVAVYAQANKRGPAPSWALVGEAQCPSPRGACYALELNIMGSGPTIDGDLRDGILITPGTANGGGAPATISNAIDVVPFGYSSFAAILERGIRIGMPCSIACLQIPSGSVISMDGGLGDAEIRFDAQTGYLGFWSRRQGRFMWAVNMTSGHIQSP